MSSGPVPLVGFTRGTILESVHYGSIAVDSERHIVTDGGTPVTLTAKEFMLLEYAEGARLYVPLTRLDLVQKYRSSEGAKPTLNHLGTAAWTKTKARVRKAMKDMADELLKLLAAAPTSATAPDKAPPVRRPCVRRPEQRPALPAGPTLPAGRAC